MEKDNCVMPEMPYCPTCDFSYIEHFEEDETTTIWHCMYKKEDGDKNVKKQIQKEIVEFNT